MNASPVSSSRHLPVTLALEAQAALDTLAVDEPLPELPPRDVARLLVQSPFRLFFHWSFKRNPFEIAERAFGSSEGYELTVRLIDVASGMIHTAASVLGFTRDFWFNVEPARLYQAETGLRRAHRPFIRFLASNTVQTPRAGVSPYTADEPVFRVAPLDFISVLDRSGFVDDALGVAGEAIERIAAQDSTSEQKHLVDAKLGDELRFIYALLAAGKTLDEIRALLASHQSLASGKFDYLAALLQDEQGLYLALRTLARNRNARFAAEMHAASLLATPDDFNVARQWFPSMTR